MIEREKLEEVLLFLGRDMAKPYFEEIRGLFLGTGMDSLRRIDVALQYGDGVELVEASHALVSSCCVVGAQRLLLACKEMEDCGRSADFTSGRAKVAGLRREFKEATAELKFVIEALLKVEGK